jgi:hypothetical protein
MSDLPMQFPILVLAREPDGTPGDVLFCLEEEPLKYADSSELKAKRRVGALFVDVTGRCWRIVDTIDMGPGGKSWRKVLSIIFRSNRLIRYELAEETPQPFEAIRDSVCASIEANADQWRDDAALAGGDGPPRDEQEMLEELIENVRGTTDMRKLIEVLVSRVFRPAISERATL